MEEDNLEGRPWKITFYTATESSETTMENIAISSTTATYRTFSCKTYYIDLIFFFGCNFLKISLLQTVFGILHRKISDLNRFIIRNVVILVVNFRLFFRKKFCI